MKMKKEILSGSCFKDIRNRSFWVMAHIAVFLRSFIRWQFC